MSLTIHFSKTFDIGHLVPEYEHIPLVNVGSNEQIDTDFLK